MLNDTHRLSVRLFKKLSNPLKCILVRKAVYWVDKNAFRGQWCDATVLCRVKQGAFLGLACHHVCTTLPFNKQMRLEIYQNQAASVGGSLNW